VSHMHMCDGHDIISLNIQGIVVNIQFYSQNEVSENTGKDRDDGALA